MFKIVTILLSIALLAPPAFAEAGMVTLPSMRSPQATMDRFESIASARGLKVFARIDHAAGALSIDQALRPTVLLIFGHPKGGTPLLQCSQTYGIDLPLHVLAWEDVAGQSWLGYKDLARLEHKPAGAGCDAAVKRLNGVLEGLVREAARE